MANDENVDRSPESVEDIGQYVSGIRLSDSRFVTTMRFARLMNLVQNPFSAANPIFRATDSQLKEYFALHEEIQREFDKGKKANSENYADYIIKLHQGALGDTPTIDLYTQETLKIVPPKSEKEKHTLIWPHGLIVATYDGETQLAARFLAAQKEPKTKDMPVIVTIMHGVPVAQARQCFHDRNAYQRKAAVGVAMAMDSRDPFIEVVRAIERDVPGVRGSIAWKSRQMPAKSREYIAAAPFIRTAVACFAHGISGVQGGRVELPEGLSQKQFEERAVEWFRCVIKDVSLYMKDREQYVASSPAIWAALGAMGHKLIELGASADQQTVAKLAEELILKIKDVNWRKGDHWEGIAIKKTPKGYSFAGGAKDSGSVAWKALTDSSDPSYRVIRDQLPAALSA